VANLDLVVRNLKELKSACPALKYMKKAASARLIRSVSTLMEIMLVWKKFPKIIESQEILKIVSYDSTPFA
jgi:hypothetical protein